MKQRVDDRRSGTERRQGATRPPSRWIPLPLEPAAPWLRLPALTRALGLELLRVSQDRTVEGIALEHAEDWALRAVAPDARERKAVRHAVRAIIEKGLLVAVPGGVRLLYSVEAYAEHRRTAADGSPKVDAPSTNGAPKVDARPTDGAPKVDASSTDGLPKVDGRSTEGLQTVGAKPSETLHGTGVALIEERDRERDRERHTQSACARVRVVPDELGDERVSFAAAVQLQFRKLHLAALDSDPAMGGTNVGTFPERLANTARARNQDPLEMLEQAFERWLAGGCEGSKRSTPYAAFIARFDSLVTSRSNGRARASPSHEFKGSDLDMLGPPAPGELQ